MTTDLAQLKRRLAAHKGRGSRIPEDLRREVLAVLDRAKAGGTPYRRGAAQLGLSFNTLMGWRHRRKRAGSDGSARIAPVRLASFEAEGRSVVHGPRGLRIEGLSVAELAERKRSTDPSCGVVDGV